MERRALTQLAGCDPRDISRDPLNRPRKALELAARRDYKATGLDRFQVVAGETKKAGELPLKVKERHRCLKRLLRLVGERVRLLGADSVATDSAKILPMLSKEKQRFVVVGLLWLWCAILIGYRIHLAPDGLALGLVWNLFLASVPLLWSSAFATALRRGRGLLAGAFFCLWLLFFPNAPYLLTDLLHLAPRPFVPLWFLLAMLLSCAGTGTLLGYLSLIHVHTVVEEKWGQTTGWIVVAGSLLLCGFGIYLGRFLRWNSWDVFTKPVQLLRSVAGQFVDAGPYPHPAGVTLIFGVGLLIGYLGLRVVGASAPSK